MPRSHLMNIDLRPDHLTLDPRGPETRTQRESQIQRRHESRKKSKKKRRTVHCMICFEGNGAEGTFEPMMSFCKCQYGMRLNHFQPCLGKWIESGLDPPCRMCQQVYQHQRITRWTYEPGLLEYLKICITTAGAPDMNNDLVFNKGAMVFILLWFVFFQIILFLMNRAYFMRYHTWTAMNPKIFFRYPKRHIGVVVSLIVIMVAIIYIEYKRYLSRQNLNANNAPGLRRYLNEVLAQPDDQHMQLYHHLGLATTILVYYLLLVFYMLLVKSGIVYFDPFRIVFAPFFLALTNMLFYAIFGLLCLAMHTYYLRASHYPHNFVQLSPWVGAVDNRRVYNITELTWASKEVELEEQRQRLLKVEAQEKKRQDVVMKRYGAFKRNSGFFVSSPDKQEQIINEWHLKRLSEELAAWLVKQNENRLQAEQIDFDDLRNAAIDVINQKNVDIRRPFDDYWKREVVPHLPALGPQAQQKEPAGQVVGGQEQV